MKIKNLLLNGSLLFLIFSTAFANTFHSGTHLPDPYSIDNICSDEDAPLATISLEQDTIPPIEDRNGDFINTPNNNPFDLHDPPIIEQNVEYDPTTGQYIITEKIGDDYFRMPTYMTFEEYMQYTEQQQREDYFKELAGVTTGSSGYSGLADPLERIDVDRDLVNRLFGGTKVDIRPQGNIDLTFGLDYQRIQDPNRTIQQQKTGGFDFDMDIQMSAIGQIGEKLKLGFNYNTGATFDFDNQMKLEYAADNFSEDEIIKSIEAGHVSLPLKGSLITGAQSLFGLKTELQFGRLRLTALASQKKSKRENIQIQGGSQLQDFEVRADEYDENRHFFVSHYNRAVFEDALKTMPQINNLFRISRIQVWITNDRNETQGVRSIVAMADIGEATKITNNNPQYQLPPSPPHWDIDHQHPLPGRRVSTEVDANNLHDALRAHPRVRKIDAAVSVLENEFGFSQTKDYEKFNGRMLSQNEYTVNKELGFISINVNLQPDQVLGIAYTYEYNGEVYKVGEFASDNAQVDVAEDGDVQQDVLFVKLIKSSTQRIDLPAWDLMMKNVYSIGAFQVSSEDFKLDIYYDDPGEGQKRFLPEPLSDRPLLQIFNLDRLNTLGDPYPDGQFDFVAGITINPQNGRIMFPVLEPFGSSLAEGIGDPDLARQYTYQMLYDSTITRAREYPEFNRFTIRGSYKSSISSEISLGTFNLPQGSVVVTAGGQRLTEGNQYEIDYNIGRVKILDDAILNSGLPINISFEDNTLFGFQTQTMLGLRGDYEFNKNLTIGGTFMHLFERPYTQKVNIGEDPISNKIYGLDITYSKEAPWLTKLVDKIPLIDTKEASNINFTAEAAALRPGHARAINQGGKGGVVFIDDFEGATSPQTLTVPANAWSISSIPQNDGHNNNPKFPESSLVNDRNGGVNRAHISWFRVDQSVGDNQNTNPYTANIAQNEVFPNRTIQPGLANTIQGLVLSYYPNRRGPYNFDVPGGTPFSAGLDDNGGLLQPESRWAGIMRGLTTNDFEAANIEYIEFWMLNPFMDQGDNGLPRTTDGGEICINLGNISEDILRDSRQFSENGITIDNPTQMDTTAWARVPNVQPVTNAFDNDPDKRAIQDVGFDGFSDAEEQTVYSDYLNTILGSTLSDTAKAAIQSDVCSDNFINPRDDQAFPQGTSTLQRYYAANNPEGNSPIAQGNQSVLGNRNPDTEDINKDNTLNESEAYFEYCIPIAPTSSYEMQLSKFVTDTIHGAIQDENTGERRIWYRFKIPLDQYTNKVGGIQDFRSIRFIRMYLREFAEPVNIRLASFDLVRNQWRRYRRGLEIYRDLSGGGTTIGQPDGESNTLFDVNAVSIEENGGKIPFGYVLPLGLTQEQSTNSAFPDLLQNEQSLAMEFCNLQPNDGRAIYKIFNLDMRVYENLKMYVHAEADNPDPDYIDDGELSVFIRLGSDFSRNYYEYEVPLTMSRDISLPPSSDAYKEEVWKKENDFDIDFELLKIIKQARNDAGVSQNEIFEMPVPADPDNPNSLQRFARVKGNPNLGNVKGIMVGIINRSDRSHCAEVWINELRVSGIDERGGAAALARLDFQMADFASATISASGNTIGWGSLEQKVLDRARESQYQYDVAITAEMSKFFPQKWGLAIPVYAQYSNTVSTPEYDPYDFDIKLKDKLDHAETPEERKEIRDLAISQKEIKSFNVTNVRKTRTNKNKIPLPWNIENFSATYAYTETDSHDPIIEKDNLKTYNGILTYDYTIPAPNIAPFKNLIKKDKYLKFITGFNFSPVPNTISFSSNMNRSFRQTTYRFVGDNPFYNTFYNKKFIWDRDYNLAWELTKALKFNFNALNRAIIDEPQEFVRDENGLVYNGQTYAFGERTPREHIKEEIWKNIQNFGRTETYNHNLSVDYTLPFKLIPFMDWVTVKAGYNANYAWDAPYSFDPRVPNSDSLGYLIQNNQTRRVNGDFSFEKLYNKSKYLKKINKKPGRRGKKTSRRRGGKNDLKGGDDDDKRGRGGKGRKDKTKSEKGRNNNGLNLQDMDIQDVVRGRDGKDAKEGNAGERGGASAKNAKGRKGKGKSSGRNKKKGKKGQRQPSKIERILIRPLLLVRKASVKYNESRGTIVPGFTPKTKYLGMADQFGAPRWDFAAGFQPDIADNDNANDWLTRAANDGWITDNIFQNRQVEQSYNQSIDGRLSLEPFQNFKIEIDAKRSFTENRSLYFKDTLNDGMANIVHVTPREIGSFSMSFFALNTLFKDSNNGADLFREFEDNRVIISQRLGDELGVQDPHTENVAYRNGLGRTQQDVLLPAFLAAYTGKDPRNVEVGENYAKNILFKALPKLNWKLTYNGLGKIQAFKEIFRSVSISHAYRSGLTVNSFLTNQEFNSQEAFSRRNDEGNFYARFEIPALTITEQFSPLIGINMKMKNEMNFTFDYKKTRNLAMSFNIDYQLAETRTTEFVFGFGYTMKDVIIDFLLPKNARKKKKKSRRKKGKKKSKGKSNANNKNGKDFKGNDMNFKFDFSFRDDITINHRLDQGVAEPTRGAKTLTISPSVDYDINKRLNVRLFFDHRRVIPATSASFPITTNQGGVVIRFSLN